ncbi:MAG: EAL domain-containing protein, partial [Gammaproteobacteria bacterium]|nr:EAL domain-containing protein [Gammaproteobacteria bacterium]
TEVEIVGAWIDVTPRRRAEERLRLDAAAIESTRDGVLITDRDGRIVSANRSFRQTMGYPEAEILGQTPSLLRSGRHGRDFYQSMWTDISSTGHWQGEVWNRRRNGEIFPVWVTINAVCNERGEPTHYVAVYTDISKLKQSEEELEHLAHFDPLTGLPNRLLLQSRLEHAVDQARRRQHHVAVLFIDLDDFKKVNDSLGHLVGDELLIAAARRLKGRVRGEDTLARLGGDEFVVLLEELHRADEAATVARDLHASLSAPFNLSSGHELYVQASIGISIFPDDSSSPAELLRDADTAMYRSKEGGGGRFRFFTSDMSVQAFATLELESALRQALERDEFLLYYQPTMDLRTERIYGAEALLRWRRSDGRILSPGEFIPIAEKTGLIIPIGNWVIDTACSQLNAWQRHDLSALQVAVNVSARQFRSGELESEIAAAINRHRIPPGLLSLELTESMLMEQPEEATEILRRLKELGVLLSLDDFGTGFSSLAYLTRFPVDTLKIDASFVSDVESDSAAMTVVNAVIELAHRMGMRAIAEGVETPSQYNYLKARGCDAMQGYLISKPLPIDQFRDLLHSRQAPAHQNRRN